MLYRLAVSPGSRALHGMAPRRGRLVRPLLGVTREEVREYLRARGLEWREDPSNADRRFARARVRHDVIEALRELSPAAERTIAETARQLREEAEVLDAAVDDALEELGGGPGGVARGPAGAPAGRAAAGAARAGRASGRRSPARELDEILALGERGTKSLDLGGGLRAVAEYGTLRFTPRARTRPRPIRSSSPVPGRARFGDWELEARLGWPGRRGRDRPRPRADRARLARRRPHAPGRPRRHEVAPGPLHRPQGPARAAPHAARVVEADGEIVWVAGVAVDERFAAGEDDGGCGGLERAVCGGRGLAAGATRSRTRGRRRRPGPGRM